MAMYHLQKKGKHVRGHRGALYPCCCCCWWWWCCCCCCCCLWCFVVLCGAGGGGGGWSLERQRCWSTFRAKQHWKAPDQDAPRRDPKTCEELHVPWCRVTVSWGNLLYEMTSQLSWSKSRCFQKLYDDLMLYFWSFQEYSINLLVFLWQCICFFLWGIGLQCLISFSICLVVLRHA